MTIFSIVFYCYSKLNDDPSFGKKNVNNHFKTQYNSKRYQFLANKYPGKKILLKLDFRTSLGKYLTVVREMV